MPDEEDEWWDDGLKPAVLKNWRRKNGFLSSWTKKKGWRQLRWRPKPLFNHALLLTDKQMVEVFGTEEFRNAWADARDAFEQDDLIFFHVSFYSFNQDCHGGVYLV